MFLICVTSICVNVPCSAVLMYCVVDISSVVVKPRCAKYGDITQTYPLFHGWLLGFGDWQSLSWVCHSGEVDAVFASISDEWLRLSHLENQFQTYCSLLANTCLELFYSFPWLELCARWSCAKSKSLGPEFCPRSQCCVSYIDQVMVYKRKRRKNGGERHENPLYCIEKQWHIKQKEQRWWRKTWKCFR